MAQRKYSSNISWQFSFKNLTTEADAADVEAFFKVNPVPNVPSGFADIHPTYYQDKDVSKCNLALNQALDTIRARAALLNVSIETIQCYSI